MTDIIYSRLPKNDCYGLFALKPNSNKYLEASWLAWWRHKETAYVSKVFVYGMVYNSS